MRHCRGNAASENIWLICPYFSLSLMICPVCFYTRQFQRLFRYNLLPTHPHEILLLFFFLKKKNPVRISPFFKKTKQNKTCQCPETFVCCLSTKRDSKAFKFVGYNIETFIFLFQHPKTKCFSLRHVRPQKKQQFVSKTPEYRNQTGTMSLCCGSSLSLPSIPPSVWPSHHEK